MVRNAVLSRSIVGCQAANHVTDSFRIVKDWRESQMEKASSSAGIRFKQGDPRAAEEVHDRVRRTLAFRGYGIPTEDRRDLEQVVMGQIWEAVAQPQFDPTAGFWGFVEVVVARRCIDWLRGRKEEVPIEDAIVQADPAGGPLASTLRREREDLAQAVVAKLPDGCRQLIGLHLEQGKTYAELAEILGASEGALRVRMHRCIQRAQRILSEFESARKSRRRL